jgi:hypothetical protein
MGREVSWACVLAAWAAAVAVSPAGEKADRAKELLEDRKKGHEFKPARRPPTDQLVKQLKVPEGFRVSKDTEKTPRKRSRFPLGSSPHPLCPGGESPS